MGIAGAQVAKLVWSTDPRPGVCVVVQPTDFVRVQKFYHWKPSTKVTVNTAIGSKKVVHGSEDTA